MKKRKNIAAFNGKLPIFGCDDCEILINARTKILITETRPKKKSNKSWEIITQKPK